VIMSPVVKTRRTLMFMQDRLHASENACAVARGTWKTLRR
jgi:hypothetical protein